MNPVEQNLADKLNERKQAGNLRRLSTDRAAVDFYSNDYLGLVTTGRLVRKMQESISSIADGQVEVPLLVPGATGSRLLSGNCVQAEMLEHNIADFHGSEAGLIFNSGYDANVGLLSSIADRNTTIIYDELCHASIIDGGRLSLATSKFKFRHNDPASLETKIQHNKGKGAVLVVVESVYSMDGDMAPLKEIVQMCENYNVQLVVDEAHATGVIGTKGEGLVAALGLQDQVFARVHTFGKALGCHGAIVLGSDVLKQYLINFARPFIYTTALPGHSLHAIYCAYRHLSSADFTNKPLHELITYFRQKIKETGSKGWVDSVSPIQALVVGDNEKCKQLATKLQQAGFQVKPILHPTVPLGMERLRVCLHSFNTRVEVDGLVQLLAM